MAEYLQKVFGGAKSVLSSATADADADFADFATAAAPSAPSHAAAQSVQAASPTPNSWSGANVGARPFTKWYRVWERVTVADFYQEMIILPCLLLIILINLWGSRANRARAKEWAASHLPLLESEFASVGYGGGRTVTTVDDVQSQGLAKAMAGSTDVPEEMLREKSKGEYTTYCTGRQNVAALEIKLSLYPRFNPFMWAGQIVASFFFDSIPAPAERIEATAYCFDGKEKSLVPALVTAGSAKDSGFDGFVWAVVHKDKMRQLRDERYDLSLTTTKDHAKLPGWSTVMSESAEVTDALLTPELIKVITDAGEDLEALIISDQPIDAPRTLDDTVPNKRVSLSMRLNTSASSTRLFASFIRLPDHLVNLGRFRPEALRKVKATRDEEMRKIRKLDEDEKAEERRLAGDKMKKEERDRKLSRMTDVEQRKFLEKEKAVEQKKGMKKRTMRG